MATLSSPKAILVAVDFSSGSRRALDAALDLASAGEEITVLHVIDSELVRKSEEAGLGSAVDIVAKMRARAERELAELAAESGRSGLETMLAEGVPFAEVVKIASVLECDLIVVGTRGHATRTAEVLFGGTAEKIVRVSRCPVLCVP